MNSWNGWFAILMATSDCPEGTEDWHLTTKNINGVMPVMYNNLHGAEAAIQMLIQQDPQKEFRYKIVRVDISINEELTKRIRRTSISNQD